MDAINLTKKLVDIPSFVRSGSTEARVASFVISWAKTHLPSFTIRTFVTAPDRVNVLLLPPGRMEVLFTAHLDTVLPVGRWRPSRVSQGRLIGTGAVDMKGAMAAMMTSLAEAGKDSRAGLLLYVDEEYDFAGMKTLLRRVRSIPRPALIVTGEPTDGKISNGCRGIATLELEVQGRTAHSARPQKGRSVAEAFRLITAIFDDLAAQARHPKMGDTLVNVFHAELGLSQMSDGRVIMAASDNRIPDILRLGVSFRTTDPGTRLSSWKPVVRKALSAKGFRLSRYEVGHEYRPMYTEERRLASFIPLLSPSVQRDPFVDLGNIGYYDIQMLAEVWKIPALSVGCGPKATAHSPNEYARCSDITLLSRLYTHVALTGRGMLD